MDYSFQIKSNDILRDHIKQLEDNYNLNNNFLFQNQMKSINEDKIGKIIDNTYLDSIYINKKSCIFKKEDNNEDNGWTNYFKMNQIVDRRMFNKNTRQKTI
uniref:Uncharacterized protein n=1 Tax=viral metagenome TaxID=1070528 RepID=A0A6C0CF14_9ZZZZ